MIEIEVKYKTNEEEFQAEVQRIIQACDELKAKLNELKVKIEVSEVPTKTTTQVEASGKATL